MTAKTIKAETSVKLRLALFKREDYMTVVDDAIDQAYALGLTHGQENERLRANSIPMDDKSLAVMDSFPTRG